jgi:hypothetical protein
MRDPEVDTNSNDNANAIWIVGARSRRFKKMEAAAAAAQFGKITQAWVTVSNWSTTDRRRQIPRAAAKCAR